MSAGPGARERLRVRVRVHYDFASTLCYVAHRVMERMAPALEELGIELVWSPLDLTALLGPWRRGQEVPEPRRANAARVARELGVPVTVPAVWPDSRAVGAAALLAEAAGRGATWRERIFTALFEEGRSAPDADGTAELARELGLTLAPEALERACLELAGRTEAAREEMVTGVPTFMLGRWAFGGIQTEATMQRVLERFARRSREGALA